MDQGPYSLCRAQGIETPGHRLAFRSVKGMVTGGATLRHYYPALCTVTLVDNRFDDLRDHIPCPLDKDRITYAQILAHDFVLVMQACPADHHSADVDRVKNCNRVTAPVRPTWNSTPKSFVVAWVAGNFQACPTGSAGLVTESVLQTERVDLDDHAVDLIAEIVALFLKLSETDQNVGDCVTSSGKVIDR